VKVVLKIRFAGGVMIVRQKRLCPRALRLVRKKVEVQDEYSDFF
jgi:hypothetical protein